MREMKDSGIEWIGEIPTTWAVITLKYTHDGMNVGESIDKEYWEESDGDRVFYTAGLNPITTTYRHFPPEKYTKRNDLLLARNGTPYVYLPIENSVYTDHIIRLKVKNDYSKKFIMYCLQRSIDAEIVDTVSIATWSAYIWNRQCFPLPTYEEQEAITSFLDSKCTEIDALSADIQKEIETLQEYRKSVITEAVTKGLDPNVEMKDSGVEWIGEIPRHWDVTRMKYVGQTRNGLTYKPNDVTDESGTLVLRSSNIQEGKLSFNDNVYVSCSIPNSLFVAPGDILICSRNGSKSLIGKNALIEQPMNAAFGAFMMIFRTRHNNKYLYYLLNSSVFSYYLGSYLTTTINQLTGSNFEEMKIPFSPDTSEQMSISIFLDTKCSEIDSIIADKQKQLENLAEYRKSLIYEYVTGKKEVPTA